MGGRLLAFLLRRRAAGLLARHRPVLLAVGVLALCATPATTLASHLRSAGQVHLAVRVEGIDFASGVEVRSACCQIATQALLRSDSTVTFLLDRGDYTVRVAPSGVGLQQHWFFLPTSVHLDRDRTIVVHGSYN